MAAAATNWTISTTSGLTMDTGTGARPAPTPTELLATRAVQAKDGWLGQIIMAGEIVWESKPQKTSAQALRRVNQRVHDAFRRLIVGV